MIKHLPLFVYGIIATFGGFLLILTARSIQQTALHTFIDQQLLEAAVLFFGIFIGGLGLFMILISLFIQQTSKPS
ncbi:hypothetical protein DYH10_00765 [Candidatus Saccharibacteria bacterium CPR2]|nr:hypothetical protein [Candidatus Saccharibacteria bacterium CPR2]